MNDSTKRLSPQGYRYGRSPRGMHPFWADQIVDITATADVDDEVGTPYVEVEKTLDEEQIINFHFDFHNLKGEPGEEGPQGPQGETGMTGATGLTPNIDIEASCDNNHFEYPYVQVRKDGTLEFPHYTFDFCGLKGEPGATGAQGPQGVQGPQGPQGPGKHVVVLQGSFDDLEDYDEFYVGYDGQSNYIELNASNVNIVNLALSARDNTGALRQNITLDSIDHVRLSFLHVYEYRENVSVNAYGLFYLFGCKSTTDLNEDPNEYGFTLAFEGNMTISFSTSGNVTSITIWPASYHPTLVTIYDVVQQDSVQYEIIPENGAIEFDVEELYPITVLRDTSN